MININEADQAIGDSLVYQHVICVICMLAVNGTNSKNYYTFCDFYSVSEVKVVFETLGYMQCTVNLKNR